MPGERGPTDYLAETVLAYIKENERLRQALDGLRHAAAMLLDECDPGSSPSLGAVARLKQAEKVARAFGEMPIVSDAVQIERSRCREIIQCARFGEVDQDFRAIISMIDSGRTAVDLKTE